jgi:hypothetical protein
VARRGADLPRPKPWTVKAADRQAALGWDLFVSQALEAADRAWVAITSDPRRTADRQHELRGSLGQVIVGGKKLDQWQVEPTAGGRVWYAIDDEDRVLWVTQAGIAHPKQTEARRRRNR